jgi:ribosomal protein L17
VTKVQIPTPDEIQRDWLLNQTPPVPLFELTEAFERVAKMLGPRFIQRQGGEYARAQKAGIEPNSRMDMAPIEQNRSSRSLEL